jgi:hypothetical protein
MSMDFTYICTVRNKVRPIYKKQVEVNMGAKNEDG